MRWPTRPPHLALNPPYFFGLFCFVFFLCLFENKKLFHSHFTFSLSMCIYIYIYIFFFCFIVFLYFFLSLVLPCFPLFCFLVFSLYLVFLLWFQEKNSFKILDSKDLFINPFCFSCLALFFFQIYFSYPCVFLILSCVFVQHQSFYVLQNKSYKT